LIRTKESVPDQSVAQAFIPDGWLRTETADISTANGYVFLKDRLNDRIISGGENIYPAEAEAVPKTHTTAKEAVVVGCLKGSGAKCQRRNRSCQRTPRSLRRTSGSLRAA
jgi:acyl-CoA synthetase (AMP-forming)/AMP-acid ligase II